MISKLTNVAERFPDAKGQVDRAFSSPASAQILAKGLAESLTSPLPCSEDTKRLLDIYSRVEERHSSVLRSSFFSALMETSTVPMWWLHKARRPELWRVLLRTLIELKASRWALLGKWVREAVWFEDLFSVAPQQVEQSLEVLAGFVSSVYQHEKSTGTLRTSPLEYDENSFVRDSGQLNEAICRSICKVS